MNLSKRIAALRAQKGVTQAQVADALGVSAPAVSKWESGRACPDVALLAPLARYFGVRIDDLLDFEPALDKGQAESLGAQCKALFADGHWDEGLRQVRALDKAHPLDHALEFHLACALQGSMIYAPGEAGIQLLKEGMRDLLERASASSDLQIARLRQFLLATVHMTMGEVDRARTLLESLIERDPIQPEQLLPTLCLMDGDYAGALKVAQEQLMRSLSNALHALVTLTAASAKAGDVEKARRYAEAQQALAELFGLDVLFGSTVSQTLEAYAKAAHDDDALLHSVIMFSDFLLRMNQPMPLGELLDTIEHKRIDDPKQTKALIGGYLDELTQAEAYAQLRGHPSFEGIIQALTVKFEAAP